MKTKFTCKTKPAFTCMARNPNKYKIAVRYMAGEKPASFTLKPGQEMVFCNYTGTALPSKGHLEIRVLYVSSIPCD